MSTFLLFFGILFLLIITHELGHFICARIFGVRVEEFGIGYPPRALLLGTWRGTEYTINWIFFGGFVRLYGEDGDAHTRGSFVSVKPWKQATILIAGVAMNALVAWIFFAVALHTGLPRVIQGSLTQDPSARLMISDVITGSPAAEAGISAGDTITRLTDQNGVTLSVLTPEAVSDYVKVRGGQEITIDYIHLKQAHSTSLVPANAVIPGSAATPALGIGLVEVSTVALGWPDALVQGLSNTGDKFDTVLMSLWQLITGIFHGNASLQNVVGPIGLVSVVGSAAQNGAGSVLALAGFIAVNLTIINLIPIPALDGGRLLIVAVEAVMRRKSPALVIQVLNTIGIALIILLMITVSYHDIARLLA
ncbi:MAG TPA: M50 family metallopeptidase [Candidatus Paceibacterota bacterium]|nr:M50 family metallopeptidase [Candidatus Paceibacterota bacterium]